MSQQIRQYVTTHGHLWIVIALLAFALIYVVRAGDQKIDALSEKFEAEQKAIVSELERVVAESAKKGDPLEKRVSLVAGWMAENEERLAVQDELGDALDEVAPLAGAEDEKDIGFANSSHGTSLAVGVNNHVDATKSVAVGEGLVINAAAEGSFVAGRFNATEGRSKEAVFAIGVGTNGDRKNALEVHSSGAVIINQPVGDIPLYGE